MWNFSFAIPSLLILGLLLLVYFSLPRLRISMNRAFLYILVVESCVIIADILSTWADINYSSLPLFVVNLLNCVYFVAFFLRAGSLMFYATSVLRVFKYRKSRYYQVVYLPMLFGVILSILSLKFGFIYWVDDKGYHSGPWYNLLYYVYWFYLLVSLICWKLYSGKLRRKRERYGLLLYIMILMAGIIVRQVFPQILLMDTFCIMAILVVYLIFENPEFYLERRGNVFNSSAFSDFIEENNGKFQGSVIGIVIHNYNELRDVYGGKQMDEGLTMITRYIAASFPDCNIFYHRRGRFMVICPLEYDPENVVDKLKERFRSIWKSESADLYLSAGYVIMNIGETVLSADTVFTVLINGMDEADSERNHETVYIDKKSFERNIKETEIKRLIDHGIENKEVQVFLQPLVSTKTGRVVGAEALSRLYDSDGSIVPPGAFIDIAERNGRINELGEQVFEKTCSFIKTHSLPGKGFEWINVNLSPIQFLRSDLADKFSEIIERYDVDPGMVHLEITEASMIDDVFLQKQMTRMTDKGFKFALDDYGTGYSNLNRLKKCPFANVKIDMSVVWDYYKDPDEILPTMIKAFKQMGFEVTAEGIEDEKMANAMKHIGCDYLQGFCYSKPIPMDEFADKYLND